MNREQFLEKIKQELDNEQISEETSFAQLDVDSLDLMEHILTLEEEFGKELSDEKLQEIKTVKDLIDAFLGA